MKTYVGILGDARLISSAPILVSFTLDTPEGTIRCLVCDHNISNAIMMFPDRQFVLQVTGRFFKPNQFEIRKIKVKNPKKIIKKLKIKV